MSHGTSSHRSRMWTARLRSSNESKVGSPTVFDKGVARCFLEFDANPTHAVRSADTYADNSMRAGRTTAAATAYDPIFAAGRKDRVLQHSAAAPPTSPAAANPGNTRSNEEIARAA